MINSLTVTSPDPIVRGYNESISVDFVLENIDQHDILVAPTGTTNFQFRLVFSENDVTTTGDGSGSGFPREEFPLEGSGSGGGRRRRRRDVFADASFYFESVDLQLAIPPNAERALTAGQTMNIAASVSYNEYYV